MKIKRRKPNQIASEFHLRKCFNCGERGHYSVECPHPGYKCDIPGHHSARCPYSVNRAPVPEASCSSRTSHSLPRSGQCDLPPMQILLQRCHSHPRGVCYVTPLLRCVHPWGGAYSPWVPFCPYHEGEEGPSCWLLWTGTEAQLRPGQGSPSQPSHPASRAPGLQRWPRLRSTAALRRCLHGVLLSIRSCSGSEFYLILRTAAVVLQLHILCSASPSACARSIGERGGHRTECVLVPWGSVSGCDLFPDQGDLCRW